MNDCELLGNRGSFGWWCQGFLGVLSFLSLFYKRYKEVPRRPMAVFQMDASKQACGAFTIHILNMVWAFTFARYFYGNACHYYWINIVIDTTLGVGITYLLLKLIKKIQPDMREFGDYGNPPIMRVWLRQIVVWQMIVVGMKIIVGVVMFSMEPLFIYLARIVLWPLEDYPKCELVFVMIVTPTVMSTFQYWVTDSFIKYKSRTHSEQSDEVDLSDEKD